MLIELTTTQFWNYQQRFKDYLDGKISLAERVTDSDKQSFETIEKNVEALNNELREHLQKIYIRAGHFRHNFIAEVLRDTGLHFICLAVVNDRL